MLDRELHLAEAAPNTDACSDSARIRSGRSPGRPSMSWKMIVSSMTSETALSMPRRPKSALDLIDQGHRLERDANLARVEIDLAAEPALQLVPEPRLAVDRLRVRHGDLNLANQPHDARSSQAAVGLGLLDDPDEDLAHRRQRGRHGGRRVLGAHVPDPRPHHQGRAEVGGRDGPRHRRGSEERPARRRRPRPGGEAARLPEPTLAHRAPRPLRLSRGVHALEPHRRAARRSPGDHALRAVRAPADRLHPAVVGRIGRQASRSSCPSICRGRGRRRW